MIVAKNPKDTRINLLESRLTLLQKLISMLNNLYEEVLVELDQLRK